MKLLVTGAKGFTGQHFVAASLTEGYEVFCLESDLSDATEVMRETDRIRPDMVVHLAGISFVGHSNPKAFYDVNVIGTQNLLEALLSRRQSVQNILLASSANIYGNYDKSIISEDTPLSPVNHYAVSKMAMEYITRIYLDRLPLFYVRPFNYTGIGQDTSFLIPKLIDHFSRCANTIELGNLNIEREFNDVRFVCQAYLKLLKNARPGDVYNICTGKSVALRSIIGMLEEISGHRIDIKVNPSFVRKDEIFRLCGNPEKLFRATGNMISPALQDTLGWMYQHSLGI